MNKADLYRKANQAQRHDVQESLREFANVFKWRSDGRDSMLDAGCGSGDVTFDLLLPILPANFHRVVGVDISKEMIDYARRTYVHPKLSFEQFNLDIELEKQHLNDFEPFDHIVSFFCLMWIRNQNICMQNFYKLLKPGGDVLLVLLAKHPLYDAYKHQSQDIRWAKYMTNVDQIITPYQYSIDPEGEFRSRLSENGFKDCDVRVLDKTYIFDCTEKLRNVMHSVSPFIDRIPNEDKDLFLDDLIHQFVKLDCAMDDFEKDNKNCRFKFDYKLLVAYAKK